MSENTMDVLGIHQTDEKTILVDFRVEGPWSNCFKQGQEFYTSYSESVGKVPVSLQLVPFLGNVLPLVWLSNAEIHLPELDKNFYQSMEQLRKASQEKYPMLSFEGTVKVNQLVNNEQTSTGRIGTCFSGGLDSLSALAECADKNPLLLTLWGGDISLTDIKGWHHVREILDTVSKRGHFDQVTMESSFRAFLDYDEIQKYLLSNIAIDWWSGFQHGVGLTAQIAPIAWKYGLSFINLSSTGCEWSGHISAGISSFVNIPRFGGTRIHCVQDDWTRQKKLDFIAKNEQIKNIQPTWHICWMSSGGENCCQCEKCLRTIYGLIAAGMNPVDYGFPLERTDLAVARTLWDTNHFHEEICGFWQDIQEAFRKMGQGTIPPDAKWILDYHFSIEKTTKKKTIPQKILRELKRPIHKITKRWADKRARRMTFSQIQNEIDKQRTVLFLGIPQHNNLGDQAIALATGAMIKKESSLFSCNNELTFSSSLNLMNLLQQRLPDDFPFIFYGGGNMGDLWFDGEERPRQILLEKFYNHPILIFPQTIKYTDTSDGREKFEKSKSIYNRCLNLTLAARERFSYEIMKEAYPKANVILVPDIVLSLPAHRSGLARHGILFCLRQDKERTLSSWKTHQLREACEKITDEIRFTDTLANCNFVSAEERQPLLDRKLDEFSQAELVITDRLHGMIFSVLTETPCIVLKSATHKTEGVFEWIKDLGFVTMVETVEEAAEEAEKRIGMKNVHFDPEQFATAFEPLRQAIPGGVALRAPTPANNNTF